MAKRRVVLSLCDNLGNMVLPWLEAGYDAITVDPRPMPDEAVRHPNRDHFRCDIEMFKLKVKPHIVFAFPPCKNMAVSGAKHFKSKGLSALIEALTTVEYCRAMCEELKAPYMIENPVSTLSTYWRKPDYIFNPYDYTAFDKRDNYMKRTCLWIGCGFIMPPPSVHPSLKGKKPDERVWRGVSMAERMTARFHRPMGFARAVFEANRK
jgi:hypothetical protein